MKNGKILIGAGAVASVAILAGSWFLGAAPLLAGAAATDEQLFSVQQLNQLQGARLAQLEEVGTDLTELDSQLAGLQAELPASPAMDDFVGRLSSIEAASGAKVQDMTSGSLFQAGESTDTSSSTDSASTDGGRGGAAAVAPVSASGEALLPVPGLMGMPLTLTALGGEGNVRDFLARLQSDGRFASMTDVVIGVDSASDGVYRLSVTGTLFVLPDAAQS